MSEHSQKHLLEALIFAAAEPLPLKDIQNVIEGFERKTALELVDVLNKEYEQQQRPYRIQEVAQAWQFVTVPEYAEFLKKLFHHRVKGRLSKPALETLSIVVYKQPVTKAEIEAIRGVNADGMMKVLLEKEFVRILGRKDVPGKPIIYGTTSKFLQYFGLKSLEDLPNIEEFAKGQDEQAIRAELEEGEPDHEQEPIDGQSQGEDQPDRLQDLEVAQSEA